MAAYSSLSLLLFLTITLTSCYGSNSNSNSNFGLDFHHRFSDTVRGWADSRGLPPNWSPEEAPQYGSVEYYQRLLEYDLRRHRGRFLAQGDLYAFNHGYKTVEYLDQLHYAFVDLGTPNQTFLVALDTGSDLFWVPCNCKQCAPNTDPLYNGLTFSTYEPNVSKTSQKISCGSDQCVTTPSALCTNKTADCNYTINYGSPNTSSSSGTLVQDVIYLINQNKNSSLVKLSIVFGCGQVQTGHLLNGGPPNGQMGLAMSNLSVPSMIANSGFTSNSFSMCFGNNGFGRLNFGEKTGRGHNTTELNVNPNQLYNISLTGIAVGNSASKLSFTAIIDSGTSISTFTDDVYKKLGISFAAQVTDQPIEVNGSAFEYCFEIGANQTKIRIPPVYFTTKGGSTFKVLRPVILLFQQKSERAYAYCFGILPSNVNKIGENFLIDQQIVFDREKKVLGWRPFNCDSSQNNKTAAPSPAPALAPSPPEVITIAPAPETESDHNTNGAWFRPVYHSAAISAGASLITIILMWHQFY